MRVVSESCALSIGAEPGAAAAGLAGAAEAETGAQTAKARERKSGWRTLMVLIVADLGIWRGPAADNRRGLW